MARIISSEVPIGGVGYQYNIEGVEGVAAIITKYGPSIGAQGVVESLLLAANLAEGIVDYDSRRDPIALEAIAGANAALATAGIAESGSLGARIERLASERDRLAQLIAAKE